jgi:hypothetical protein
MRRPAVHGQQQSKDMKITPNTGSEEDSSVQIEPSYNYSLAEMYHSIPFSYYKG